MAVTAAQVAQLKALTLAYTAAVSAYNTALAKVGAPPVTDQQITQYQADSVNVAANRFNAVAPPNAPGQAYWPDTPDGSLQKLWIQTRGAYNASASYASELYGQGTNFISLLPFLFVGALGATVGVAAAGATTASGAAATTAAATTATAATAPTLTTIGTGAATAAGAGALTVPLTTGATTAVTVATAGATTLAGSVGSAVTSATGSTAAGAVASSAVSGIGDLISDFKTIFGPIASFANTVLTDVENIDKEYIVPFTSTIAKDYTTITGLVNEVQTLSKDGIQGILAIPSAISSALTSIDAANLRLAQATGQINQGIATDTLVPGIGGAIASPLTDLHTVINSSFNQPVPEVAALSVPPLSEADFAGFDPAQSQATALAQLGQIKVFGPLIVGVIGVWKDILQFIGYLESWVSFSAQAGRLAQPIEPIGIGETIKAWWRGQMTPDDAVEEIKRHGVEPTRAQLLYDLEQWLPGPADAIRMFYQGILTSDDVNSALGKQGLSQSDITALVNSAPARLDAREAMTLDGRTAAATAGFLQSTLGQDAPDSYKQLYPPRVEDAARAPYDWKAHWDIRDISWWATAYFRGLASAAEFELACQAFNIAPEMIPNMAAIEQETIQLWMIPDMIATNLFTQQEALDYLAYIGIAPRDAALIVQYGQSKAGAGAANDALGLGTVALGTASKMYADGIINNSEYTDILEAHKLTPEAVALIIQLEDQNNALEERRSTAKTLIKQVSVGVITLQQMQQQMYQAGYTQQEVDNYTAQANAATLDNAKFPSEAQIKAFHAAGILTSTDATSALQTLGYSPFWANAFMTLWGASSGAATNTTAT